MIPAIALCLALAWVVTWDLYPLILKPRTVWQHRPAHARSVHPRRGPEAGPAPMSPPGPAGTAAACSMAGEAAAVPPGKPGILNPRLYETGEMPGITQAAADELWWSM